MGVEAPWLAPLAGAALGAAFGSFIGCARYRLPRGLSLRHPPSSCMACGHLLTVPDLVPVLSWLALRGRCRKCGVWFGASTLGWEVLSLLLGAALGFLVGPSLWFFPLVLGGLALYAAAVINF